MEFVDLQVTYLTILFSAVQIKENEMDGTCSTYGQKRNANTKPEDKSLEDLDVYGRIILKRISNK
jgi:hypothetical protein